MANIYLSIGSNVDRQNNIQRCIAALAEQFGNIELSTIYECPAVGFEGQDFFNLAAQLETELQPGALDQCLKNIEDIQGRDRSQPKFSDRCIDIDLLLYDDWVGEYDGINLPRDEILKYAFVLKPLAELAPQMLHPQIKHPLELIWQEMLIKNQDLKPAKFQWR